MLTHIVGGRGNGEAAPRRHSFDAVQRLSDIPLLERLEVPSSLEKKEVGPSESLSGPSDDETSPRLLPVTRLERLSEAESSPDVAPEELSPSERLPPRELAEVESELPTTSESPLLDPAALESEPSEEEWVDEGSLASPEETVSPAEDALLSCREESAAGEDVRDESAELATPLLDRG